jgi:chitinase
VADPAITPPPARRSPSHPHATASEVASVIFSGQASNTVTAGTTIGSTPPTNWIQPTGVSRGTTSSAFENIGTNILYRLAQSGTIAPGNVVLNRDGSSSIWHMLIKETVTSTHLTASAALSGSGALAATATASTTGTAPASIKAVGTVVDGGSSVTSITLPVPVGAASGDYLVAVLYNSVGTSASDWAMGSTGFTRIGPAFIASDAAQRTGGLYGLRLTGAPPASYTFTTPDSGAFRNVGVIIALSNVNATNPVSASTAWAESNTVASSLVIPGGGNAGDLTLEYVAADFTAGNTYAGAPSASGPLDLQANLISPAGTENTAVARTMVRIYGGIAPSGGVPTTTYSTTANSSHRAAFLISFAGGGGTPSTTPAATLAGSGALVATVTGRTGGVGTSMTAYLTGYGYPDNTPANSDAIAYPNVQHSVAGGTGTYANPVSMATAITTTGGTTGTGTPTKVLAGYLEGWSSFGNSPTLAKEGPAILPSQVNSNYNALIVAFATIAANGTATFSPEQNVASLKSDIAAWKAAGKVMILSVGGAGGNASPLDTTTRQNNFLSSVKAIIDAYGFQGIDWDIEVGGSAPTPSVPGMTAITNNLVATYGSNFLITMAPYGATETFYKQLANAILPSLTWVNYQFYNLDANPTAASIKSKIAEWLSAVPGMTAAQFMVGFMTTTDDYLGLKFPYTSLVSVYDSVEATYPTLGAPSSGASTRTGPRTIDTPPRSPPPSSPTPAARRAAPARRSGTRGRCSTSPRCAGTSGSRTPAPGAAGRARRGPIRGWTCGSAARSAATPPHRRWPSRMR